eukprot:5949724-Pleurochrysis_carterae.AAC.2
MNVATTSHVPWLILATYPLLHSVEPSLLLRVIAQAPGCADGAWSTTTGTRRSCRRRRSTREPQSSSHFQPASIKIGLREFRPKPTEFEFWSSFDPNSIESQFNLADFRLSPSVGRTLVAIAATAVRSPRKLVEACGIHLQKWVRVRLVGLLFVFHCLPAAPEIGIRRKSSPALC